VKKKFLVPLMVVFAMLFAGCASYSPDVDQTAVEQNGYLIFKSDKNLVGCHRAGTSGYGGVGNQMFYYPAGQRTFSFTGTSTESEEDPIPVVTKDGQTLHIPGFIKFTLTSNCQDLWDFHRKVGMKYQAYTEEGWKAFLNDYLGVAVNSALNDATGTVNWRDLYQDAAIRGKIESNLTTILNQRVSESLGSDKWIHVTGVSLAKPIAPQGLVNGLMSKQKVELENQAQQERNVLNQTKYDSMKDCLKAGISEQGCITIYLADKGKVPFYPVPEGGSIQVAPGR